MIEAVTENLRFMVHEVVGQVELTLQFFAEPSRTLVDKINSRDDYVDTLKSLILDKTYQLLQLSGELDKQKVHLLQSVNTIAANLERIADFSVNILRQAEHLSDLKFLNRFDHQSFFEEILTGLEKIQDALRKRDIGLAFRICQCEFNLDELYASNFNTILSDLRAGGHTGNLITSLMIMHYLERMGDSLLNIGEAIIYALVGEKMKIQQYRALTESLNAVGLETPISDVEFESIWGTRSGCRIGVVGDSSPEEEKARPVLFKHGNLKKLGKEKENIAIWEKLAPGLPPKVYGFVEGEDGDGSILLEYLPGCTFQELVLTADEDLMKDALYIIQDTIGHVWRSTLRPEPVSAGFVNQVRSRMEAVYRLHPGFNSRPGAIGDLHIHSFGELLHRLDRIEDKLGAPFSLFIHGDMNVNNIIYDSGSERLHFIDLHRSGYSDFVQDVSVFLTSLFRLPVFEPAIRRRLNFVMVDFFEFAQKFAMEQNDALFEARLALGLGRSFFTSTRFELNRRFAKKMYLTSLYLLEKLIQHQDLPWESFELPREVFIY